MSATVIPAEILEQKRRERARLRRDREALQGSILGGILDEKPEQQPVCGVASEPIGDTVKWLKQILTP